MRPHHGLALAVAMQTVCIGSTFAEVADAGARASSSPKISAYVIRDGTAARLLPLAMESDKRLGLMQDCKGDFRLHVSDVTFLTTVEMTDEQVNPSRGDWLTSFEFTRCGETKRYNAIFSADSLGGQPKLKPWYPGRSTATPRLIQDAMALAVPLVKAKVVNKGCGALEVLDMHVEQPLHALVVESNQPLKEVSEDTWTFVACGQQIDAALTFVKDSSKGGFDIQARVK
jgi:hypothetical protein